MRKECNCLLHLCENITNLSGNQAHDIRLVRTKSSDALESHSDQLFSRTLTINFQFLSLIVYILFIYIIFIFYDTVLLVGLINYKNGYFIALETIIIL